MIDNIKDILESVTVFDFSYIILSVLFIIRGAMKGFVLSILSTAKWVLAYVLTIFIFQVLFSIVIPFIISLSVMPVAQKIESPDTISFN